MDYKCNCKSGTGGEIILTPPDHLFKNMGRTSRTICVDKCIAHVIKHLWKNDIVTLGCCCGHNKANPSVVIETTNFNKKNIKKIFDIIAEVDSRQWEINIWKIIKYIKAGKNIYTYGL